MAVLKCKMCGGTLEINNNETVITCEYCNTQQTLPRLDDDRRANLYDRANHFRRNNEFDKAMGIYENILNEDNTDAEAYWSLVLCRYGIEYVEDPVSHKRIPTVNRAQFTSVFDDDNYKSALQYADNYQRTLYEKEAKAINEIQKGILAISQKEEPFDVFICYKETDNDGRRTPDSVLANDLYHQLTQEGFKVFFARITLEDKLGSAYEPYIFAALNSAKVMVVLGTKPEYFNAVWVRNEWSRYLALIKQGQKKMLIPAYKDMDPYGLPDEFAHLQAQDMSKLGFMQDLIRGIKKIAKADEPKATVVKETVVASGNSNAAPFIRRAFMFLEDGDWKSAYEYCEKVLDIEPENASAYLGKLMADLKVRKQELLKDCANPFDNNNNYQKAVRFADAQLKSELTGYIEYINTRNENARIERENARLASEYSAAKDAMFKARSGDEDAYKAAARLFDKISEYKDSAALAKECYEKAEIARKDNILDRGKTHMCRESSMQELQEAKKCFYSISGWKDADEQLEACQKKLKELEEKAEADRLEQERYEAKVRAELARKEKRRKVTATIRTILIFVAIISIIASIVFVTTVVIPNKKYNEAIALMEEGKVIEAYEALIALDGYKDSKEIADSLFDEYKTERLRTAKIGDYVLFGTYEQDNDLSNGKEDIEWLVLDVQDERILVVSKHILDGKPYTTSAINVTWKTCTLRQWLNNDFIDSAFSDDDKSIIRNSIVQTDGEATQDRVFLLSKDEVSKYLTSKKQMNSEPTEYAYNQTEYRGSSEWWVLRWSGKSIIYVDRIYIGDSTSEGLIVGERGIRPALWIELPKA